MRTGNGRLMSNKVSMVKNILSNISGYFVSILTAFIITPITIHTLGDARYGAWALVGELIGYYGLLDLGFRGAVTYHVARYSSLNKSEEIKETLSSAFWILTVLGALVFLIGAGITIWFQYIFKNDGLNLTEVRYALLIMSGLIGLSLPINAFSGGIVGKERFDVVTGIEVLNRVLTAICLYIVLKNGGGLVALALVQVFGRAISWTITLISCRKILGGIFARPKWFRMETVRDLVGYGFRNAIGQVALLVIYRVDLTVVAIFVGIKEVAIYSIASSLVSYASTLGSTIAQTFTPRFTKLASCEDNNELADMYFLGMRTIGMVITGMVAGMLVFGKDFIHLWIGASYINGPWTNRSDVIMVILILANLPRMLQSISWQRLFAMARVRFLMWLNVCEAIANLSLSILFVKYYGAAGVALGTFFPLMVSHLIVMPIYSSRAFNIPLAILFRKGLAVPLITGMSMAIISLVLNRMVPPDRWWIFFCEIILVGIIGILLCFRIGFSTDERKKYFTWIYERTFAHAS